MFLTDLTITTEKNREREGAIYFPRYRAIANVIKTVLSFQETSYALFEVPQIQVTTRTLHVTYQGFSKDSKMIWH